MRVWCGCRPAGVTGALRNVPARQRADGPQERHVQCTRRRLVFRETIAEERRTALGIEERDVTMQWRRWRGSFISLVLVRHAQRLAANRAKGGIGPDLSVGDVGANAEAQPVIPMPVSPAHAQPYERRLGGETDPYGEGRFTGASGAWS